MKKAALLLLMALTFSLVKAQDELPTAKGNKLFNFGVGMFGASNPSYMPVHLGMDFFIINNLSMGFDANWRYYYAKEEIFRHQLYSLQVVVDYHFNELMHLSPSWDFYAGVKMGPGYMYTKEEYEDWNTHYESGVRFVFDGRVGFRYYFNSKIGVNSEVGFMNVSKTNTTGMTFMLGITANL